MSCAIIGGTGVEHLSLEQREDHSVHTPYGQVAVAAGYLQGQQVFFLSRHGHDHSLPPHLVNYRGNLWALHHLGVSKIIATAAVGSISPALQLGMLVLPDQFIDFTKQRATTFYQGENGVLHVDMSEPYCPGMREVIRRSAAQLALAMHSGGVYVCTEGPRFETPAEIRMFRQWGGDMVGMTGVPEVVLARELGMCYATVAMVTNAAAGIADHPLTHAEGVEATRSLSQTIADLFVNILANVPEERYCRCAQAALERGKF
ncbi:MAG: S-methyl-5'-thioadenosine phosphorylase [Peptococcaceae bacterium]|jgi:5'-methylthioadenosine phosphorylase|nr:S-methyl-5'-thioadenosine phosphorylase [Peptococcaceae bacterium]